MGCPWISRQTNVGTGWPENLTNHLTSRLFAANSVLYFPDGSVILINDSVAPVFEIQIETKFSFSSLKSIS